MSDSAQHKNSLLEQVAKRGLEQRRAQDFERYTQFFAFTLRDLPKELKPSVKLISQSRDQTLVRLEIAGQPFNLETSFTASTRYNHHRLYHAHLPLQPAIATLEEYSRKRAVRAHRDQVAKLLRWSAVIAPIAGLALYGVARFFSSLRDATPGSTALITIMFAAFALLMLVQSALTAHPRLLRTLFPPTLEPISPALRDGFERWPTSSIQPSPDPLRGNA